MDFIDKILGRKVLEERLFVFFENSARSVLAGVEKSNPFYSVLFRGEDLAGYAVENIKIDFLEIAKLDTRKMQSRKSLSAYFRAKQEEIFLKFFSYECGDVLVAFYSASLADEGDIFLKNATEKFNESDENYEEYANLSRAYFKKKYWFQVYKNQVFLLTLQNFFGEIVNAEFLRKFELLIAEHAKKTAAEKMLQVSRVEGDLLQGLAIKYDFSEIEKRTNLIRMFIQAVEFDSEEEVDAVCDEFVIALKKNFDVVKEFNNHVSMLKP